MVICNCFNIMKFIENRIGGFDDSLYIVEYTINKVVFSINSIFDWEKLCGEIEDRFPQADFSFMVVGLDLIIKW